MKSNSKINFLLPDGNPQSHNIKNNEPVYFIHINKDIYSECPLEYLILVDLKSNKIISKYKDKLEADQTYKLFAMQQVLSIYTKQNEEIEKLQKEKTIYQKELDAKMQRLIEEEQNKFQDLKNQGEAKIKNLEEEINKVQKELQVAKDKEKDLKKSLESLQYDLKVINSQQDMYKQDMIKQLQEKDQVSKQLTEQCQKYVEEIKSLNNRLQQSSQSYYIIQEQFQQFQQQASSSIQQWQYYSSQLESDKKNIQQEKVSLETEIRRFTKKTEQYEEDLSGNRNDISKLKREKYTLDQKLLDLQGELNQEQENKKSLENTYKLNLSRKEQEIKYLQEDYNRLQQKIDEIKSNCQKQIKDIQEQQEILRQTNTGKEQVISDEIQNLQRQLHQENEKNDKLSLQNEEQRKQLNQLQIRVDECEQQINQFQVTKENLEIKLKQFQEQSQEDNNQKQQQIEQQKQLQQEANNKLLNQQELNQKYEEDLNQWKVKGQNYENDIKRLKEAYEKVIDEKKKFEEEFNKQRQELVNQIQEKEAVLFQKDFELIAIQNSAIVPVYQFRIQRLVECVAREYNKDIEFAIETMILDKVNPQKFIENNQATNQKLTFNISQVQLIKAKAEETLYNLSDQDYRKCAQLIDIGQVTGIQCFVPVNSSETSLDKYYFFQFIECPKKKEFEGKIFGIKQYKKQDVDELETKETAIDNCLSTVIAQNFMNKFVTELKEKKAEKIYEFKFRDQYIIETKKHFNQVLKEQIQGQQLVIQNEGLKNYIDFIEQLNDEQSNEFYNYIKEYQTDKNQPKDGNIIKAFVEIIEDKKLQDFYSKFKPDLIRKEFNHFIDFIGGNMKEMPQKLCYSIQEIELNPDFQKYNGGHMKFDTSQEGKFLSAFSYYSIVKSQRQLCISHLQGVKNQLYDPLVSTYDGFLDKMDQGFNEIRTIESKFLSETNLNKGVEYMKALGIKWN